jgi:hypothetical protein
MSNLSREQSVRTGLPAQPLTENPEIFSELVRVYNAIRIIIQAHDLHVGEPQTFECGENIAYGQTVGIKSDGKVWLADDGVQPCHGFCNTPGGGLTGEFVSMQIFGLYPEFAAGTLTPGARYYQSSTAGSVGLVGSAPATAQVVGFAMSDTQLYFMPNLKY